MPFSRPHECKVCKRVFFTPQDLISHINAFHSNHLVSTFSSSASTTTFRHYPNQNRNLSPGFPMRNHFDLNCYRSGYLDDQGRFHNGFPPAPAITSATTDNILQPNLMELFPATSSEDSRTLSLLCQLEQRRPENTVMENGGANSSSIDLSLRLVTPEMTSVKGLLKGLRYITQIFDEEKDKDMQIGFPTDVKHVAHIGSEGPAANMPSWMGDFKPQENENSQVVSRGDSNNNQVGEGVGLQELLPPPEKPKQKKTRRKSETGSQNGSPPRRNSSVSASDMQPRPSRRHHRRRHGSVDSSNDPSVRRRRVIAGTDMEGFDPLSDDPTGSTRKSTSRHRKPKGSGTGEQSMKKAKGKTENPSVQAVDKCNDNTSDKD